MKIPKGEEIDPKLGNNETHVLKLQKKLYGQKQASRQFCIYVSTKLIKMGFDKSKIDKCMFFMKDIILVLYVDDGIIFTKDATKFEWIFKQFSK